MKRAMPFIIGALMLAILTPIGISQLVDGQDPPIVDTHIAVEDVGTPEVIALENFPVLADSESITVNATPIAKPAEYTIVDATGVVTIAAASSIADDIIITNYRWTQLTGTVRNIWTALIIIAIVGVLFMLLRGGGVMSSSRGKKGGG